nr:leucine-rich repeat [Pandoravirus massiliensis]
MHRAAEVRKKVPTLISLAVSALRASGRLDDVRVLRVARRDRQALVGYPDATRVPLVVEMHGLVEISLRGARIDAVPDALACLAPTLAALDVSRNHLTDLPSWMSQFSALRMLDLSSNQFAAVPACMMGMRRLACLDMSNNTLDCIPDRFGRAMGSLRQLHLCDAFARGPRLSESFAALTDLRHLSLCCSPTLDDEFDSWDDPNATSVLHPLWDPVYALTNLRSLVLHGALADSVDGRIARLSISTHQPPGPRVPPGMRRTRVGETHGSGRHGFVPYFCIGASARVLYSGVCHATRHEARARPMAQRRTHSPGGTQVVCAMPGRPVSHGRVRTRSTRDMVAPQRTEQPPGLDTRASNVLYADGGGPFVDGRDYGLFDNNVSDDGTDGHVYQDALAWRADRGDGDGDSECDATTSPLAPWARALMPVELIERAAAASLRTCALCARSIIGLPSRVDTTVADQRNLLLPYGSAQRMNIERALCSRCALAADARSA